MFKKILNKKTELFSKLDPQRIYVENIRAFFGIPTKMAKLLCEMAVKERVFRKKVGVCCSNDECGRIIKTYNNKSEIDEIIFCDICESLDRESHQFNKNELDIIEFYQLAK